MSMDEYVWALIDNPASPCPEEVKRHLRVVTVPFWSGSTIRSGQLVVHEELTHDMQNIFATLTRLEFPITRVVPIAHRDYLWDDERSMAHDNTSAFNYRTIAGTDKLSLHAFGRAIDINPLRNPYIRGDYVAPRGATYEPTVPGTITDDSFVVALFLERGFQWGGHWHDRKDYQHFEKPF